MTKTRARRLDQHSLSVKFKDQFRVELMVASRKSILGGAGRKVVADDIHQPRRGGLPAARRWLVQPNRCEI